MTVRMGQDFDPIMTCQTKHINLHSEHEL
jgi:hypothetical protein